MAGYFARSDVDLNVRNVLRGTPLHCAADADAAYIAELLLARSDVDVGSCDVDDKTALWLAEENGAFEVCRIVARCCCGSCRKW